MMCDGRTARDCARMLLTRTHARHTHTRATLRMQLRGGHQQVLKAVPYRVWVGHRQRQGMQPHDMQKVRA
jgi:hypothetical protein